MSWLVEMVGQAASTSEDMNKRKKNGQSKLERQLWYLIALLMGAAFLYMMFKAPKVEARIKAGLIDPSSNVKMVFIEVTPTPHVGPVTRHIIEQEVRRQFGHHGESALKVMRCEGGYDPRIKSSGSTARGLFQIIIGTWEGYDCQGSRMNYKDNIACAKKIFDNNHQRWNTTGGWAASYHCHQQP